ncbi:MAG: RNA polymerase subunit sigma-70 [Planctomycetia bacterium]|nr:RNA polymerase subunit sigma-70 [Planctomycetia bacterium]
MRPAGSVTLWIAELKAGNRDAAQRLWNRYFHRLVGLARHKLHGRARPVANEEDVALSAFDAFYRAAEDGRFPQLDDRADLWRLLMVITARKALRLARDERRLKRGGGQPHDDEARVEQLLSAEPTPAFAAEVAEEFQRLLALLDEPALRDIALDKLAGGTNEDIAARLECAPRTIERKLKRIRALWEAEPRP